MKRVGSGRVKGLTPLQRRLCEEIEEIASIINMDHWNILQYAPEARTTYLQLMRIQLVRSEVISLYTLIDEYLTVIICNFYFRKKAADRSFKALWKRPKFKVFNHHIMDEIFLARKLEIVRAIKSVPKEIVSNVMAINDLRNALAHSFFPENRRRYMPGGKVAYKGVDVFTKDGVQKLKSDFGEVTEFLEKEAFGK